MRINTQISLCLLFGIIALSIQCQKDLDKLPSNIQLSVDIINLNEATISAEVRNPGEYDIEGAGFLYAEQEFDCNDNVQEISGTYDLNTNLISGQLINNLTLDSNFLSLKV